MYKLKKHIYLPKNIDHNDKHSQILREKIIDWINKN